MGIRAYESMRVRGIGLWVYGCAASRCMAVGVSVYGVWMYGCMCRDARLHGCPGAYTHIPPPLTSIRPYINTRGHAPMQSNTHAHIPMQPYTYTHVYMHPCIHTPMFVALHPFTRTTMGVWMYGCMMVAGVFARTRSFA